MSDELLHALGDYFVRWRIGYAFGITFSQFVEQYNTGQWKHVDIAIFGYKTNIK
jgi:hypothetical protein